MPAAAFHFAVEQARDKRHLPAMTVQPQAKIGAILASIGQVIRQNAAAAALVMAGLTAVGSFADSMMARDGGEATGGALQLGVGFATIFALYWLTHVMLESQGLRDPGVPRRMVSYFGQAIVISLAVIIGLLVLIVPGLILAARWSLAQPLLIGRGAGAMDALGESWRMTAGSTLAIIVAGVVVFGGWIAIGIGMALLIGEEGLASIVMLQIISNAVNVLSVAFVVALFGLLAPAREQFGDVFG